MRPSWSSPLRRTRTTRDQQRTTRTLTAGWSRPRLGPGENVAVARAGGPRAWPNRSSIWLNSSASSNANKRGKTEGRVKTYRWNLCQYLEFIRGRRGRPACVGDVEPATIQAWMDSMAAADLALGTMRVRQSTLSSLCAFLVKRGHLDTNPVARLDRPPHRREAPRQVPGSSIMDALVKTAQQRKRPRDLAIFLILRYSGMRRESVATLRVRNLDRRWGLRNVPVKGGKTRDIPLPAAVMQYLDRYLSQYLPTESTTSSPTRRSSGPRLASGARARSDYRWKV